MDRNSRQIIGRNGYGTVTTVSNIGAVLDILEANYGNRLYKDTNSENVLKLWASMFVNDDPREVLTAVKEYIENESYPPTIADIKKIMKRNRKHGESMTITEIVNEANRLAAAHGMQMTEDLRKKHAERVKMFRVPMTKIEIMIVNKKEEMKGEKYL